MRSNQSGSLLMSVPECQSILEKHLVVGFEGREKDGIGYMLREAVSGTKRSPGQRAYHSLKRALEGRH